MLALSLLATLLLLLTTSTAALPITFGTGQSQYWLSVNETTLFTHTLSPRSTHGTMTVFWCTGDANIDTTIWRYYIDNETMPSIQFTSAQAAGVGFLDQFAPWGNKWIGKGADDGAWYVHFPIPFQGSIRVTGQLAPNTGEWGRLWSMFRGTENLPITVANYVLPVTARLVLSRIENTTFAPLEFVTLANITSDYNGVLWAHYLTAQSTTRNYIEGCYHAYNTPTTRAFPGLTVSTGTEDYFDSAYDFNAGAFRQANAGLTHSRSAANVSEVSAYRLHDSDPVFFERGFRFEWRVGDVSDERGLKCRSVNGTVVGSPQPTTITTYTWVYVWPAD